MQPTKVKNLWVLRVPAWESGAPDDAVIPVEHDILSFTHALWTPSAPGAAPEVQDLSLVLRAGPALPAFIASCMQRQELGRVVIEMRETRGSEPGMKMRYELLGTRVASVRPGGSHGSAERPLYEVAFCFEEMRIAVDELQWSASTVVRPEL